MASQTPPSPAGRTPQGDPWHAVGYLTAGVLVYGLIGWGLDRWLGTSFLVVIGILAGAGARAVPHLGAVQAGAARSGAAGLRPVGQTAVEQTRTTMQEMR